MGGARCERMGGAMLQPSFVVVRRKLANFVLVTRREVTGGPNRASGTWDGGETKRTTISCEQRATSADFDKPRKASECLVEMFGEKSVETERLKPILLAVQITETELQVAQKLIQATEEKYALAQEVIQAKEQSLKTSEQLLKTSEEKWEAQKALLKRENAEVVLDSLRAKNANNSRGLIEFFQERIIGLYPDLKGAEPGQKNWLLIWKELVGMKLEEVSGDCTLGKCLSDRCSLDESEQPKFLTGIYSTLSEHVHDGKTLARITLTNNGSMKLARGPLTTAQCEAIICIGRFLGYVIEFED